MGRGRKPQPTALKVLKGNPGKRELNRHEPISDDPVEMPEGLSPLAAKQWDLIADQLKRSGILTALDTQALALYCEAFARWKDANDHIAAEGAVIPAPSGYPVQSPYVGIANKSFDQMRQLLIEFGMTPSARSKVQATKKTEEDPLEAYISKRR